MKRNSFLAFCLCFALGVQAQVNKSLEVTQPGELNTLITQEEIPLIRELTLTGKINAKDFKTMRDQMPILSKLDISSVEIIAYQGSDGPQSGNISYPANAIPAQAFYTSEERGSLTEIAISDTLREIGYRAFRGCIKLKGDLKLPDSLTYLGNESFYNCKMLNSIDLSSCSLLTNILDYTFGNCGGLNNVQFAPGIKEIRNRAFEGCAALVNAPQFPDSLTTIGEYAFNGCTGIREEVTFPAKLKTIGSSAFNGCFLLTSCKLTSSIPPTVGSYAFNGTGLAVVVIPNGTLDVYKNAAPWNSYTLVDNQVKKTVHVATAGGLFQAIINSGTTPEAVTHLTVTGNLNSTDFEIIRTRMKLLYAVDLSGTTVSKISEFAFQGKRIISMKLPQGLIVIGEGAFKDCRSLSGYIEIPATLKTISAQAFQNCSALTSISFSKELSQIGSEAFSGCSGLATVDFSNAASLSYIDNYAFYRSGIKGNLQLPEKVGTIGSYAFSECQSLTSVGFPQTLTNLGSYAFQNCQNLSDIDFSASSQLTQIGNQQFIGCTGLNRITFPPKLSSIGSDVFSGCSSLSQVEFPETLTSIGSGAFYNCTSLSGELTFSPLLTNVSQYAFQYCRLLSSIKFPASTNTIGNTAFHQCSGLERIILQGITPPSFGSGAFDYVNRETCRLIVPPGGIENYRLASGWNSFDNIEGTSSSEPIRKSVNLAEAGTLFSTLTQVERETTTHLTITGTIDARDFNTMRENMGLLSVLDISKATINNYSGDAGTLGGTQNYLKDAIPQYAFYNPGTGKVKNTLTEIVFPENITSVGFEAFRDCRGLSNIIIPSKVTKIENRAFIGCSAVKAVQLPASIHAIGDEAFSYCSKLSTINFPNSLTTIGNSAFRYCSAITSIKFPASIASLGTYAFANCTSLNTLDMSEATSISTLGGYQFAYCTGLTTIKFPSSLSIIGDHSFHSCTGLTQLELPEKLTEVNNNAFNGCTGLIEVNMPLLTTCIGSYVFYNCTNLTKITTSPALVGVYDEGLGNCKALSSIVLKTATPPTIYSDPFSGINKEMCKLEVFPDAVETYSETAKWNAFKNIQGTAVMDKIEKIVHLEQPGTLASALTELELKTTTHLTITGSVDARDFKTMRDNMTLLNEVDLGKTSIINYAGNQGTQEGTQTYLKDAIPQQAFINKTISTIILPEKITSIAFEAFRNCRGLKEITIPSEVKTIETLAFMDCIRMKSIVLPASLISIANNGFENCSKLAAITFPEKLAIIGEYAFRGCSSLNSLTLPASITSLGREAFRNCIGIYRLDMGLCDNITTLKNYEFENCRGLSEIVFPKYLTNISNYAFANCSSLITIDFPSRLTNISDNAFQGCTYLTELTFPSLVSNIGYWAFNGCTGLSKVTLSPALTSIGQYAFYNCTALSLIISKAVTPPSAHAEAFNAVKTDVCKISVLPQSLESYQTTNVWKNFKDIQGTAMMDKVAKELRMEQAGTMDQLITDLELKTITHLKLTGKINARDFRVMRDQMQLLADIDLSEVQITSYSGNEGTVSGNQTYLENTVPNYALNGKRIINVTLPETLTAIGANAFRDCTGLSSIVLPDRIINIAGFAFFGCSRLVSVQLPAALRTIGVSGFEYCGNLQSIDFPETLASIGDYAFRYDYALNTITLPASIATLGRECFRDCKGMYKLDMSKCSGITALELSQFQGCIGLNEILFPQTMTTIGNSAFQGCSGLTELALPTYLTTITNSAFADCTGLKEVYIPSLVETIRYWAFSGCTGMTSITLPAALHLLGDCALYNCSSLSQIISKGCTPPYIESRWAENVKRDVCEILVPAESAERYKIANGWKEFAKIRGGVTLEVITKSVQVNEAGTLKNILTAVEKRTITDFTVTGTLDARDFKTMRDEMPLLSTIDLSNVNIVAYSGNDGLVNGNYSSPANEIPQRAFYNLNLDRVRKSINKVILPESITSIGLEAFIGCRGILDVEIPDNVIYIKNGTFAHCMWLKSAKLSQNLVTIEPHTFFECYNLKNLVIPSKVTTISNYAFMHCTSLESITLPSSLVNLGTEAFRNCIALQELDMSSATMLTQLVSSQFRDCTALVHLKFPATMHKIGSQAFYNCKGLSELNLPISLQTIEASAFENCIGLSEVIFPPLLSTIGYYSFNGCTGLTQITLPAGTKNISSYAFSNCTGMNKITSQNPVPPTATSDCFNGINTNICELNIPIGSLEAYQKAETWKNFTKRAETEKAAGTLTVHVEAAGTLNELLSAESKDAVSHLTLTGTIDARDFKTMRDLMMQLSIVDLTNVTILGYIGENGTAATGRYPANTIPECAFYDDINKKAKKSLILVMQPLKATTIGKMAFKDCDGLTSLPFVQTITTIEEEAYAQCDAIGSVIVPKNVSTIGNGAFAECRNLNSFLVDSDNKHYTAESGVLYTKNKSILQQYPAEKEGEYAVLENTVEIAPLAFCGSSKLTRIQLPETVVTIGTSAFKGCSALAGIDANAIVCPKLGSFVFEAIPVETCVLNIPKGGLASYQADEQWKAFIHTNEVGEAQQWAFIESDEMIANRQTSFNIPISLKSSNKVAGLTMEITIPTGIQLNVKINDVNAVQALLNSEMKQDHQMSITNLYGGKYRVEISSSTQALLQSLEGVLFNLPLSIAADAAYGTYYLAIGTMVIHNDQGTNIASPNRLAPILVNRTFEYGDVNNDGVINILDVTTTVNYIIGMNPENFLIEAADVNMDGGVNIFDVVRIVNKVLGKEEETPAPQQARAKIMIHENKLWVNSEVGVAGIQYEYASGKDKHTEVLYSIDGEVATAGFQPVCEWDENNSLKSISLSDKDGNPIETKTATSIQDLKNESFTVHFEGNEMIIKGLCNGNRVEVYDLSGTLIYAAQATDNFISIQLPKGVYIIRCAANSLKVYNNK